MGTPASRPRRTTSTASGSEPARGLSLNTGFFAARVLPETASLKSQLEAGADTVMAMPAEMF